MENKKEQSNNKRYYPKQSMLVIRGILGGYLVYLAYDIIRAELVLDRRIGIVLCAIFLLLAGTFLFFITAKSLIRGEYTGGKADTANEEEEEDEQNR